MGGSRFHWRLLGQGRAAPAGLGLDGDGTEHAGNCGARRGYPLHRLQTRGWGCVAFPLINGEARRRRDAGARTVTLTNALRPPAHKMAWQTWRGARHNACYTRLTHRAQERSEWGNFV
jgi:hypothetical protein